MGQISSKSNPGQLHAGAKLAASKCKHINIHKYLIIFLLSSMFAVDNDELSVLKATWQDLADRSGGKGIDKETFLQYFPLNGLLGDRLFAQFDVKGSNYIDFDEFVTGLATVCRGSLDEKIHFIFKMYDVSNDKSVDKQELETLLNQVPKEVLLHSHRLVSGLQGQDDAVSISDMDPEEPLQDTEFEEVNNYTNHDMVEKAFEECDLNHEGRLTYEEFKMWIERNPEIVQYIESILPYNGPKDEHKHVSKQDSLPHMKRVSSLLHMGSHMGSRSSMTLQDVAGEVFNHSSSIRRPPASAREVRGRSISQPHDPSPLSMVPLSRDVT